MYIKGLHKLFIVLCIPNLFCSMHSCETAKWYLVLMLILSIKYQKYIYKNLITVITCNQNVSVILLAILQVQVGEKMCKFKFESI